MRDVIAILNEYGVSYLPVLSQEPPVVLGEVLGSVDERSLTEKLFRGEAKPTDRISQHMGPRPVFVGTGDTVAAARSKLQEDDAVMVTSDGTAVGMLTRHDLLSYLSL